MLLARSDLSSAGRHDTERRDKMYLTCIASYIDESSRLFSHIENLVTECVRSTQQQMTLSKADVQKARLVGLRAWEDEATVHHPSLVTNHATSLQISQTPRKVSGTRRQVYN